MSEARVGLPGYWELLWMLFMQPVELRRRLKACGLEKPDDFAWRLWWAPESQRTTNRSYLIRMMLLLLTATPLTALMAAAIASRVGIPFDVAAVASIAAVGVAVGTVLGMGDGAAVGVAFGMASGMFGCIAGDSTFGVARGVAVGMALGVAIGVVGRASRGRPAGVGPGLGGCLGGAVVVGIIGNVAAGVAFGVGSIISIFRLQICFMEAFESVGLWIAERHLAVSTLRLVPVLHHELSYLPHPFLLRHVLLVAERDPALTNRVLEACAIAPGQRRTGQAALAQLQARELSNSARTHRFTRVVELRADEANNQASSGHSWLPGVEGAAPALLGFRDVARYLAAAAQATIPHHRIKHIEGADQALVALGNQLLADKSVLGRALLPILPTWKSVALDMRQKAEADADGYVSNPFRPGDSLDPEIGQEVFRGRDKDVSQIELLLADPTQSGSIALLAPRRAGKSSLLKMLPALLPDAICIFFDLQDNPVDSPAGFFRELYKTAKEQARRDHRLTLPPFPEGTPFEAGAAWFRALDAFAENRRILLCIDEFERLETLFPGDKADLLKLMGLFRATIQHRRKLRLLVSGAAPFDELGDLWNDHFINVQEVHLDLLDQPTSLDLLMRPIPGFPEDAVPLAIAEAIYARTGGQPFLLQAYGSALISRINEGEREPRTATMDDLAAVEETVLSRWKPYFADTIKSAPAAARKALSALAAGKEPALGTRTRRWLERRCLITKDNQLRIPVLGAWIRAELDE
ncbi:MAG: AAA family ATPase [Byssovorax sp.]